LTDNNHGLSRIENQFEEMKGPLETRPIYVQTEEHIFAHLLTCMIALIMIRLIQRKYVKENPPAPGDKRDWTYGISGRKVQKALQKWKVIPMGADSFWFADVDDPDLDKLLNAFGLKISRHLYTDGEMRRLKKDIEVF
jgi:hypothetical protein